MYIFLSQFDLGRFSCAFFLLFFFRNSTLDGFSYVTSTQFGPWRFFTIFLRFVPQFASDRFFYNLLCFFCSNLTLDRFWLGFFSTIRPLTAFTNSFFTFFSTIWPLNLLMFFLQFDHSLLSQKVFLHFLNSFPSYLFFSNHILEQIWGQN